MLANGHRGRNPVAAVMGPQGPLSPVGDLILAIAEARDHGAIVALDARRLIGAQQIEIATATQLRRPSRPSGPAPRKSPATPVAGVAPSLTRPGGSGGVVSYRDARTPFDEHFAAPSDRIR